MEINNTINHSQLSQLKKEVNSFNKQNNLKADTNNSTSNMGKNEFLKLLTIQLSKQDPLSPMKNTEFISQMAQFSALEQMTKVNKSIDEMGAEIKKLHSDNLLGKEVAFVSGETGAAGKGIASETWQENGATKFLINKDMVS